MWNAFRRDETPKLSVFSLVNHTHPAATKFFDDVVVRDGAADEGLDICHFGGY